MKVALADADDSPTHASYPHFDARYLRAIELAIRQAWAHLLADPTEASRLATNTEVQISHQLRAALNGIREGRIESTTGYNCNTFERPQLGAEVLTSAHAIRKPDLTFSLAGPPRPGVDDGMEDAIFVECKLIEQGKGV